MKEKLKQDHFKVTTAKPDPETKYLAGRGAQFNTANRFFKHENTREHVEGIDDWDDPNSPTIYMEQESKSIVNKIESQDVGMAYSMNPYAGCEHGCIYCFARNVHEYWGYSAGLDFERKIIVKKKRATASSKIPDAPEMGCHTNHAEWEYRLLSACGTAVQAYKGIA